MKLEVREREELGLRHTRRLRSEGLIPASSTGKVTRARSSFRSGRSVL